MRIAVVGAGGIGGYYGALLARAGHDVVFIARGPHLEARRRRGLTVRTAAGETTVPVTAVAETAGVKPVELVLFCVKSYDTIEAARAGSLLADPEGRTLLTRSCLEVAAVAAAEGAPLGATAVDSVIGQAATLPPAMAIVDGARPRGWPPPRGGRAERRRRPAGPEVRRPHPGPAGHRGQPVRPPGGDARHRARGGILDRSSLRRTRRCASQTRSPS